MASKSKYLTSTLFNARHAQKESVIIIEVELNGNRFLVWLRLKAYIYPPLTTTRNISKQIQNCMQARVDILDKLSLVHYPPDEVRHACLD